MSVGLQCLWCHVLKNSIYFLISIQQRTMHQIIKTIFLRYSATQEIKSYLQINEVAN